MELSYTLQMQSSAIFCRCGTISRRGGAQQFLVELELRYSLQRWSSNFPCRCGAQQFPVDVELSNSLERWNAQQFPALVELSISSSL